MAGAALAGLLLVVSPAAPRGTAGFSAPFRLAGPISEDLQPPQVTTGAPRAAVVASGVSDIDAPASARATVIVRGQRGGFHAPHRLRGVQQILALAIRPGGFMLLAGASGADQPCCSEVIAIDSAGRQQRLVSGLGGATQARLVPVGDRLLGTIATQQGVWAAQTTAPRGGFGSVRRLSAAGQLPQGLAAASLPGSRSLVAWTAGAVGLIQPGPGTIFLARGSAIARPAGGRAALTVPSGREIGELGLAGAPGSPVLGWIESWFDGTGAFHSELRAADPASPRRTVRFSAPDELASGLTLAAGGSGQEVAAFSQCRQRGSCTAAAAVRGPHGRFGAAQRLGPVDPEQPVAATVASDGRVVVGWIFGGHVLAATTVRLRFGRADRLSRTGLASGLTLAPGPGRGALAVWNQATVAQRVVGASLG